METQCKKASGNFHGNYIKNLTFNLPNGRIMIMSFRVIQRKVSQLRSNPYCFVTLRDNEWVNMSAQQATLREMVSVNRSNSTCSVSSSYAINHSLCNFRLLLLATRREKRNFLKCHETSFGPKTSETL